MQVFGEEGKLLAPGIEPMLPLREAVQFLWISELQVWLARLLESLGKLDGLIRRNPGIVFSMLDRQVHDNRLR